MICNNLDFYLCNQMCAVKNVMRFINILFTQLSKYKRCFITNCI